jgi:hypothetical protein
VHEQDPDPAGSLAAAAAHERPRETESGAVQPDRWRSEKAPAKTHAR